MAMAMANGTYGRPSMFAPRAKLHRARSIHEANAKDAVRVAQLRHAHVPHGEDASLLASGAVGNPNKTRHLAATLDLEETIENKGPQLNIESPEQRNHHRYVPLHYARREAQPCNPQSAMG